VKVKVGDLVKRCEAVGFVVSIKKSLAEVKWLNKHYLTPLQYVKDLEVISESR